MATVREPEDYIDQSTREAQEIGVRAGRMQTTAILAVEAANRAVFDGYRGTGGMDVYRAKVEAAGRIAAALIMSEAKEGM